MSGTLPTEDIEHNGTTHTISFEWAMKCSSCDHITRSTSDKARVSCGSCHNKTARDEAQVGKYFTEYLKYSLFTTEESSVEDVTDVLQGKIDKYEAMKANGWEFDCTTGSSHVAMHKGDVPQQKITA